MSWFNVRSWRRLAELQDELGAAILLIGHDIGLMAQFVDTLGVMYAGRLVETGTLRQLLREPKHPLHSDADRQFALARAQGS